MKDIHEICKQYGIQNYTINEDGSIDVNGSVNLFEMCRKLPLKFRNVTGNFYCGHIGLETLEGSPENVGGSFYCINNELTSLKGSPKVIKGGFYCTSNKLTSLEDSPSSVGDSFICVFNKLTSLMGITENIGGDIWCYNNKLVSLSGLEKVKLKGRVFTDYIESVSSFLYKDGPYHHIYGGYFKSEIGNDFYVLNKEQYLRNIKLEQIIS